MKQWLYIVGLSLALVTSALAQAAYKIDVVNIFSIFHKYPKHTVVAKQLAYILKTRSTKLQTMESILHTKIQNLKSNSFIIKTIERSSLKKLLVAHCITFSKKAQAFEQDNRCQTKRHNKILRRFHNAIRNTSNKEGYDIIIDSNVFTYTSNAKKTTADLLKQVK